MSDFQKDVIIKLVYIISKVSNITDENVINQRIQLLLSLNINDAIDQILITLNNLLNEKVLKKEDVFSNIDLLLALSSEKYKTEQDLINRLNWIREMNIEFAKMSLSENHQLVLEIFDKLNELLKNQFDCYYTGGLMGYIATDHELERYHGDLDLFINEKELINLKELIDISDDFEFVSNMSHKEVNGHEYEIVYKGTPISIGLFLFERNADQSITFKEYYYEDKNPEEALLVNENHFSKKYTDLSFSNKIREHNGFLYKMMSLESIYNSKKNSRPKDKYDANIIKDKIDELIDYELDIEKGNNYEVKQKKVTESIIHKIEEMLFNQQKQPQNTDIIIHKN